MSVKSDHQEDGDGAQTIDIRAIARGVMVRNTHLAELEIAGSPALADASSKGAMSIIGNLGGQLRASIVRLGDRVS
jgi:hypothetical protein